MSKTSRTHSLSKGQRHQVTVESLAAGGEGVAKSLGPPIFINRVVPGDVVEVELFDVRKDFAKAKVTKIIKPSEHRAEPPCPVFKVCGGCQWQHMTYEYQLTAKEDIVKQALKHIGKLDAEIVQPIIGAAENLHYRNKAQFPVKHPQGSDRILAGYYRQDSHELVNIKHCPVQPESMDHVLDLVKNICEEHAISAYDERSHRGLLRHINIRYSFEHGKSLLTLVLNASASSADDFQNLKCYDAVVGAAEALTDAIPDLIGVSINLNNERGNKILGDLTFPIHGADRIQEVLRTTREDFPEKLKQGLKFDLSSSSFFQVNTHQAVKLLEQAYLPIAALNKENLQLVDAYAGVGAISLWLAPLAGKVIAIEDHPAAVRDGRLNAELNGIDNVEFREGRVEEVLLDLRNEGVSVDVIVVDPPRKGMSPEALEALLWAEPELIVYVSCNPATLARDLKLLETGLTKSTEDGDKEVFVGYKTKQVQPVDLFPQTFHVESVSVLERLRQ
ncbi:MAG: 23S rRNA (uracil(1939)-C(5))-methyltransferase RlmD [Cyanobacteria bacterium SZAS-4]|nr:23S rRNA (uracil(1939)-C(5))-methyltransferase RlmD [Cyanobacteria bacterium SZAS-4]